MPLVLTHTLTQKVHIINTQTDETIDVILRGGSRRDNYGKFEVFRNNEQNGYTLELEGKEKHELAPSLTMGISNKQRSKGLRVWYEGPRDLYAISRIPISR